MNASANADEGEREKGTMMSDSSGEEDGENLKRRRVEVNERHQYTARVC